MLLQQPAADQAEDIRNAADKIGELLRSRRNDRVVGGMDQAGIVEMLEGVNFSQPHAMDQVIDVMCELLRDHSVRSDHPRYFGLFNPPALPAGIIGDLITAAVNPQLAVWSHAPGAAEMERAVVNHFGSTIWGGHDTAGCLTSGGTEANAMAVACALAKHFPAWPTDGIPHAGGLPTIYASSESHLAWIKIARNAGLGSNAVRLVQPEDGLRLGGRELAQAIRQDEGRLPILIVGTAGTTAHGSIDHLGELAEVAGKTGAYFHVDAAWAGGLLLDPGYRPYFPDIGLADSVTIDPHKWLAVPMGAGMFLGRDWSILNTAYNVSTSYMPSASTTTHDAYIHSPQWSRRFIGGKVFAAIMHHGVSGYGEMFDRQITLGGLLRRELDACGWRIMNDTDLPVVCFLPPPECRLSPQALVDSVHHAGKFWISHVALCGEIVLRACVTSYETTDDDVRALVEHLCEKGAALDDHSGNPTDALGSACFMRPPD